MEAVPTNWFVAPKASAVPSGVLVVEQLAERLKLNINVPEEAFTNTPYSGWGPAGFWELNGLQGVYCTSQQVLEVNTQLAPPPTSAMTMLSEAFGWRETNADPPLFQAAIAATPLSTTREERIGRAWKEAVHEPCATRRA